MPLPPSSGNVTLLDRGKQILFWSRIDFFFHVFFSLHFALVFSSFSHGPVLLFALQVLWVAFVKEVENKYRHEFQILRSPMYSEANLQ